MVTIEELKKQNQKLREQIQEKQKTEQKIADLAKERNRLIKEQRTLMRQKKFNKVFRAGRGAGKVGKTIGKGAGKVGLTLGRGLFAIAKRIEAAERRERIMKIKLARKQTKRKSPKKTTKKRRRR